MIILFFIDRFTKILELKLGIHGKPMDPNDWRHRREVRLYIQKHHGKETLEKFLAHHAAADKHEKKKTIHRLTMSVEENIQYQGLKRQAFHHLEKKGVVRHTRHDIRTRLHPKTA